MGNYYGESSFFISIVLCFITVVYSATDPNDLKILIDFRNGLENPELLQWPNDNDDPCGPPKWKYVFCSGDRVTQIQAKELGLKGPLPQNFNQLSKLSNLGLQKNKLNGKLPTFSGLSELQFAYLDFNEFDSIPADFFDGLTSLSVLALDYNPLNKTTGWSIPPSLRNSAQIANFSCINCNLVGQLPEFLGTLPSLTALKLSYNRLSGEIPASFGESLLQILWLNDQDDGGMTGPIDVVPKMVSLKQLWLHGNHFTGTIPEDIGDLTSLKDLNLNRNQLVGLIPKSLANMKLDNLVLNNNLLIGPIPEFKAGNVTYDFNSFCQSKPGMECAPDVNALLGFLGDVNYPLHLVSQWSGNDPCLGPWLGLSCGTNLRVSIINLPRHNLTGSLSPSVANLDSLVEIRLQGNSINGIIPKSFKDLKSLRLVDLSSNNISPPLPEFREGVKIVIEGNPLLAGSSNHSEAPSPATSVADQPPSSSESPRNETSSHKSPPSPNTKSSSNSSTSSIKLEPQPRSSKGLKLMILIGVAVSATIFLMGVLICIYFCKRKKKTSEAPGSIVVHPRDPSDCENMVKIAVSSNNTGNLYTRTISSYGSSNSGTTEHSHMTESGNLVISVQVLRKATHDFAAENELGRGGFGTVYKGELEDGTHIAVKRMEAGVINSKALDEFQAEIGVLSKVRHRHLVSLLGYSIEGNERLLVYEYMPQGALSRHLFHWKSLNLKPLSWTRRLSIALDVARGMEYLHNLARETFIHRDLKSSNILIDDEFHAKVSDFGLVKLAPDGEKSVATKLAGTFGYLAPEYAVMGKITTKADVFSFGVVLMEILTGLTALDEHRSEESRYLAEWFWRIQSSKETLMAAIDPALEANEKIFESIYIIAELAGHCTARDPYHRPDMSHAVNVLAPLVQKWKPFNDESESYSGLDLSVPLPEMLKFWKETERPETSCSSFGDSRGSIPGRPTGFADSFTSADAR